MGRRTRNVKRTCRKCGGFCAPNYFFCKMCHPIVSRGIGGDPEAVLRGKVPLEESKLSERPLPEDFGGEPHD